MRYAIRWFKCKLKPPKKQINLDLIEIIQFSLKIDNLLRNPNLWVGVWVDGYFNGWACQIPKNRINHDLIKIIQFYLKIYDFL